MHKDNFKELLTIIEKAKSFGYKYIPEEGHIYGHVPHLGEFAWFHKIYDHLSEIQVKELEENMSFSFPLIYRNFLLHVANGLNFYSDNFRLYGYRFDYVRTGHVRYQPYNIVTTNNYERPKGSPDDWLFIGGYCQDGSELVLEASSGKIYRTAQYTINILNEWSDFWTMLISETKRFDQHFDETGHYIGKDPQIDLLP